MISDNIVITDQEGDLQNISGRINSRQQLNINGTNNIRNSSSKKSSRANKNQGQKLIYRVVFCTSKILIFY